MLSAKTCMDAIDRDGFAILPGLLSTAEVGFLRGVIEGRLPQADTKFSLVQKGQVKFALTQDPRARDFLLRVARRPQVLPVVTTLQQAPFIDHSKSLIKLPGGKPTPWHQDANYWKDYDPQFTMVTLWIALTPCRRENGCMRFIPGSHRGPVHPSVDLDEYDKEIPKDVIDGVLSGGANVVDCSLEPGDAVFFHNKLIHSAYTNSSGEVRLAVKIAFQDRNKRKAGTPPHPTTMEIPFHLDVAGGEATQRKGFARRLADAARVLGPPFSTPVEALARLRKRSRDARMPTITRSFKHLRQFQLHGIDREWSQLFFYSELLQKLDGVPGDVAEFGVAGGISLISIVRILRMLERGDGPLQRRMVYGFDSFAGLPELDGADVVGGQGDANMRTGGYRDDDGYRELFAFAEKEANLRLIKGWFNETLPPFLATNPATSFALVHIDCDLYQSTKVALDLTWDRVVPGGIVAFDELFHKDYPGETLAFREFLPGKNCTLHQSRYWPEKKYLVKTAHVPA